MYTEADGFTLNGTTYYYLTTADLVAVDGWYDGASVYVGNTLKINPNQGVYYFAASYAAKSLTTAGEVSINAVTTTFVDPYTAWASAFPVALNPNDSRFTWTMNSGDQIIVMYTEADGFTLNGTTYYYLTTADLVAVDGWYDGASTIVSTTLATAGQGVYVFAPTGGSVVEASPLAP
jgi:hypothetical protein